MEGGGRRVGGRGRGAEESSSLNRKPKPNTRGCGGRRVGGGGRSAEGGGCPAGERCVRAPRPTGGGGSRASMAEQEAQVAHGEGGGVTHQWRQEVLAAADHEGAGCQVLARGGGLGHLRMVVVVEEGVRGRHCRRKWARPSACMGAHQPLHAPTHRALGRLPRQLPASCPPVVRQLPASCPPAACPHLMVMHPPSAGHQLAVPGLAAAHAGAPRLHTPTPGQHQRFRQAGAAPLTQQLAQRSGSDIAAPLPPPPKPYTLAAASGGAPAWWRRGS